MVKMIKAGKKPEEPRTWFLDVTFDCKTCGAVWQLEASDPVMHVAGVLCTTCPTCDSGVRMLPPAPPLPNGELLRVRVGGW